MTIEEMLAKLENATEDETVELMKEFAEAGAEEGEELDETALEEVAGGATYVTTVADILRRYNNLSEAGKKKWKNKLKELINNVLKRKKVLMPF